MRTKREKGIREVLKIEPTGLKHRKVKTGGE